MNTDHFFFDNPDLHVDHAHRIDVPIGISSKEELLSTLARVAGFPDYFGENWDALNDCLNDFHWVHSSRIVLIHHDLPLAKNVFECANYLDILYTSAEIYPNTQDDPVEFGTGLEIYFPPSQRNVIAALTPPAAS